MSLQDFIPLYDFETAIEGAVKTYLTENSLKAYVSSDDPELQRERPRVEIVCNVGAMTDHRSTHNTEYRPDTYVGTVTLTVITDSTASTHSQFRAGVRYLMGAVESALSDDANGVNERLPLHSINRFVEAGTSPTYKADEGSYESQIVFEIHFNIRPAAWPAE